MCERTERQRAYLETQRKALYTRTAAIGAQESKSLAKDPPELFCAECNIVLAEIAYHQEIAASFASPDNRLEEATEDLKKKNERIRELEDENAELNRKLGQKLGGSR